MPHRLSTEWPAAWMQPFPDPPAPRLPDPPAPRSPRHLRRRAEGHRGTGALRTGRDLQLISYLLHHPEAVAGQGLPRAHHPRADLAVLVLGSGHGWITGRQRAVVDLAVQRPRQVPDPQPSRSGTVVDRVGGQLMDGQ